MEEHFAQIPNKEPSLKEKVDSMYSKLESLDKKQLDKISKIKIPRRAKVSKSRMKKGWCGVLFLNESRCIGGQKTKLEGGTYKTKDDGIHVTNGKELMFWEGKYPILFQRYDKLNPTNLFAKEGETNEMYGQDLVRLRYKQDLIKDVKKGGGMSIVIIIAVLVAGYFVVKMLFPKLFGGG